MSRLFKLKEWYSVEDSASRLSTTLGEAVTAGDVLQLMVEKQLPASWLLQHQLAVPVALAQALYIKGAVCFDLLEHIRNEPFPEGTEQIRGPISWYEQADRIVHLDGVYTLNLNEGGAGDFLTSWITDAGAELYGLDGTIVFDDGGTSYQLLERFEKEDMEHRKSRSDYDSVDSCYPSSRLPEKSQLVVKREHLERFEASLIGNEEKEIGNRERDTLYKIIIGMAVQGYRYDPVAKRNDAITEITADLEKSGIAVGVDTVRTHIKRAAEVLPGAA